MLHPKLASACALLLCLTLAGCDLLGSSSETKRIVISSADDAALPESARARYRDDAVRLALRQLREEDELESSPVVPPDDLVDPFYHALIHVYNARDLKGRDAVAALHTFPEPALHTLIVAVDSTARWTRAWQQGQRLTGHDAIDALMLRYALTLDRYHQWSWNHAATLHTDVPLNLEALARHFEPIEGIRYAEPNGFLGGGGDIEAVMDDDYVQLRYSVGYGDCPAGCIYYHYWTFRVTTDGRVTFEGESGDPPPPEGAVIP